VVLFGLIFALCVWRDLFLGGGSDYFLLRPHVHGIVGEHSPSIFFPSTPADLILAPSGYGGELVMLEKKRERGKEDDRVIGERKKLKLGKKYIVLL
jgi:hypothetical protein